MMNKNSFLLLALLFLGMLWLIPACAPESPINERPRADLIFTVKDNGGNPVPNAQVLLFPFRTPYEDYLSQNPNGDPSVASNLDPEDIAVTNSLGEASFVNRSLASTSSQQGDVFIHQPNSIYFRVQGELNGSFVTNDSNDPATYRLAFPELEGGEFILEEIEVFVR